MKSVRKVNDKMKEEARNKKVPPKKSNDEILSALYRHNNFDSIKDESLDIDISACVTINADGLINGSSLSSSDFWRVLDESARNSELDDVLMSNHDSSSLREFCQDRDATNSCSSMKSLTNGLGKVKNDQPNSFSGTFVRPEPPSSLLFSPIKKAVVKSPPDFRQFKIKDQIGSQFDCKTTKTAAAIKEEPIDQEAAAKLVIKSKAISNSSTSSEPIQCSRSTTNVSTTTATTTTTVGTQNQESTVYIAPTTRFKCLDCNSIFLKDRQDYVTHYIAKHRIKFVCSECNREFEQEVGLKKHFKSHRPTDGRKDTWKICPECGKCLKHGSMWMHRKIHSENKQYGCDICGQKFVQKINLTHHSRMHTAEKPYECPECQKRFQERSHLQRHQKYHAQIRSFRCDKCGKMYKTERCLKVHNLVHLEQRPFACKVCDKSFISNSKLKQHSNIHTGERPFKCNYCPRDFTNFPNWLKHTRRRHKVDHKTGEHLENIPSYCSKKSTKAATKPAAPPKIAPKPNEADKEVVTKPQIKRNNNKRVQAANDKQKNEKNCLDITQNTDKKTEIAGENVDSVMQKSKRERKQLTPKQVQEAPVEEKATEAPATTNNIKREIVDNCGFPDLHTLSITSAEEFIMEQALQMEECGLYESPVVDTDNAISAETAAEMHFKIKREISANEIKREENFLLNGANQRLICSSLESSPFSSPASIELSSTKLPLTCPPFQSEIPNGNLFFLPSTVAVNNSNVVPIKLQNDMDNAASISNVNIDSPLLPQLPSMQFEDEQLPSHHTSTQTSQLLLNQLYLPMTVSMPFMMQSNQMLPSVNTLLFTTPNSNNYLYGNNDVPTTAATTTTAQQNLCELQVSLPSRTTPRYFVSLEREILVFPKRTGPMSSLRLSVKGTTTVFSGFMERPSLSHHAKMRRRCPTKISDRLLPCFPDTIITRSSAYPMASQPIFSNKIKSSSTTTDQSKGDSTPPCGQPFAASTATDVLPKVDPYMKSVRKVNDKMKEEARNKKVPPKKSNDEILSALYRHNNFDSIKDESLDIDISACVTINADGLINGSSLSSSDFWRVLDESARNSELDDVLMSNHDSSSLREFCQDRDATNSCSSMKSLTNGLGKVKNDQPNSFSGTFVRPEPPSSLLFSPIKKAVVKSPPDFRQFKIKDQIGSQFDCKTTKTAAAIKEEPIDQEAAAKLVIKSKAISNSSTSSEPIQCSRSTTNVSTTTATTTTTTTVGTQNQESTVYIAPTTRFKCLDCNSIFLKDRQDYVTHYIAKHHIKFVCSECNREFEQEVGLKKHFKSHRPTDGRKDTWKICPECGKCLKHGSMWMHRKIHSENKQYGCDICGQKFVQKINLTHHSRMHTAEKPYECPECQKRFQERSHLQRHQKYHAQIRSFRCDKCGKMYKTERCLKVHNLVHLEQRPFACKVCDKSFISNSKLKQHSNIHTGERPFKCNYCPRDFTNFPNWLKHTRRRHKVDHKTGEHLENIPSYCSKKSTKAATKPAAPPKIAPKPNEADKEVVTKPQIKRNNNKRVQAANDKQKNEKNCLDITQNTDKKTEIAGENVDSVMQKSKRERKQLTPKQVQEAPVEEKATEAPATTNNIKREIVDNCGFPDLHTLSITSAEEFIMEQALQMEECGLYESPVVDTDNAISAETAAEMHFKIKREISANEIKREENFLLNGANQRLICSSLESSPFSSPASIELSSTKLPLTCPPFQSEIANGNLFFLPSTVAVNNSNVVPIKLQNDMDNAASISNVNIDSPLLPQLPSMQFEDEQLPSHHTSTQTSQLLLNQLYLPMTVSMPFMMQSNQMLPSVNTLLFTTPNSNNYLYGNNDVPTTAATTTTAQQNLT
ncbi:uncharacterized protein LOC119675372 [Teleopsis dalmanni]|uniref:uncharacterized protein LOC119675372 n=1 Tax=Teleopsis dalmanni TaxID=139649 RepID=UPI0018CC8AEF|nr:uncharacterized protein LOC119675372 [Teleopsis dalmanni]